MKIIKLGLATALTAIFLPVNFISAEDIRIPVGQQAANQTAIAIPATGMTKEKVRTQFGEPLSESAVVGKPPISHWKYAEFTVYFEYDHVIHAVRQLNAPAPGSTTAPTPDMVQ